MTLIDYYDAHPSDQYLFDDQPKIATTMYPEDHPDVAQTFDLRKTFYTRDNLHKIFVIIKNKYRELPVELIVRRAKEWVSRKDNVLDIADYNGDYVTMLHDYNGRFMTYLTTFTGSPDDVRPLVDEIKTDQWRGLQTSDYANVSLAPESATVRSDYHLYEAVFMGEPWRKRVHRGLHTYPYDRSGEGFSNEAVNPVRGYGAFHQRYAYLRRLQESRGRNNDISMDRSPEDYTLDEPKKYTYSIEETGIDPADPHFIRSMNDLQIYNINHPKG